MTDRSPAARGVPAAPPVGDAGTEVRLTPALVVLVVLLGASAGLRPAVASPAVAAVLWVGLVSMVVLGALWPLVDRRSRSVVVSRCPTDVVEGVGFALRLEVNRSGFPLRVDLDPSIGSLAMPTLRGTPETSATPQEGVVLTAGSAEARAIVTRRGVYETLPVQVTGTGPFGLLRVRRVRQCRLDAPLHVGPTLSDGVATEDHRRSGIDATSHAQVVVAGDTVRTVRPYVPGDPAHLVHWPTSAHAGELMVMELEPPGEPTMALVVDLRDGTGEAVEHAVRRAAGTVRGAIDRGTRVVLCTATVLGPRVAEVHSANQAQRLLAAAAVGVPGEVPEGCTATVLRPEPVVRSGAGSPGTSWAATSSGIVPHRGSLP